jgi:hypothetical protein
MTKLCCNLTKHCQRQLFQTRNLEQRIAPKIIVPLMNIAEVSEKLLFKTTCEQISEIQI